MIPLSDPRIITNDKTTQLCYDLPHHINKAKVYPVSSTNGSSVIVYGHDNGVRIVWRGGRPFKPPAPVAKPTTSSSNGVSSSVVMLLDSDSEDEVVAKLDFAPPDYPAFEDQSPPSDPLHPYPAMLQSIDLPLGVAVLQLAFPNLTPTSVDTPLPAIVKQRIILLVSCSDCTLRAITLPLSPPSPAFKAKDDTWAGLKPSTSGIGRWGEQVVLLSPMPAYAEIPNAIALTFTPAEDSEEPSKSGSKAYDLLIASHVPTLSGTLHIYRLPLIHTTRASYNFYGLSSPAAPPFQTHHLASPANRLAFNPSSHPSHRHAHLLLTIPTGAVKIYAPLPKCRPQANRRRSSFDHSPTHPGEWLITLHPPFSGSSADRKRVLAAEWVLSGRAVLVLLADGEWGVWDIEGAGPSSATASSSSSSSSSYGLSAKLAKRGLRGGALTSFALSGYLSDRPRSSRSSSRSSTAPSDAEKAGAFALRTPGTRKRDGQRLFAGDVDTTRSRSDAQDGWISGGLVVRTAGKGAKAHGSGEGDEQVVFWLGHEGEMIKGMLSLRGFWEGSLRRERGGGTLFSQGGIDRLLDLGGVDVRGGRICGIDILPAKKAAVNTGNGTGDMSEIVVWTESRLVFLERIEGHGTTALFGFGRAITEEQDATTTAEEAETFGLGLGGIDRVLDGMGRRNTRTIGAGPTRRSGANAALGATRSKRKVGFATS